MSNENEFCKNGVAYVAVEGDGCRNCAFEEKCIADLHNCSSKQRSDNRDIIWTRKLHE